MKAIYFILLLHSLNACNVYAQETDSTLAEVREIDGFEQNHGQFHDINSEPVPYVLFKAEAPGLNVWITTTGITYQFFQLEVSKTKKAQHPSVYPEEESEKVFEWKRIDMILLNASISTTNLQPDLAYHSDKRNYYCHRDTDGKLGVQRQDSILIKNVYPHIDWAIFKTKDGGMKHEFIVHPGANPNDIQLVYEGAGTVNVSKDEIVFSTPYGNMIEGRLLSYQTDQKNTIESEYNYSPLTTPSYSGAGTIAGQSMSSEPNDTLFSILVSYTIGNYNTSMDLVIDPELIWGTLFGGNGVDGVMCIDIDKNDNVYLSGYTSSLDFPVQDLGGYFEGSISNSSACFLMKFASTGALLWSTYIEGDEDDIIYGIGNDSEGNSVLVGNTTSSTFPVLTSGNYFQDTYAGNIDGIILKFNPDGFLVWSTYFGGDSLEFLTAVAMDAEDNIYLTGRSEGTNFPLLDAGGYFQGTTSPFNMTVATKFSSSGQLLWSTLIGGSNSDFGNSLTVDTAGALYITGVTKSDDFPTLDAGTFFQGNHLGEGDLFIVKFDPDYQLIWATYYGGNEHDEAGSIVTDLDNNIFLVGETESLNFPTQDAGTYYQGAINLYQEDMFILKFDQQGNRLWGTYYGAFGLEVFKTGNLLAVDNCNNIYFACETRSHSLPNIAPNSCSYQDDTNGGNNDISLTRFSNNGELNWSTLVGASRFDYRCPIAVDNQNDLYLAGEFISYTSENGLPLVNQEGAFFDNTLNGADDSYVLKFKENTYLDLTKTDVACPCDGYMKVQLFCGVAPFTASLIYQGEIIETAQVVDSYTFSELCIGEYTVFVESACGQTASESITLEGDFCPYTVEPNLFSPNDDGINDVFFIPTNQISPISLRIYNRWGEVIYEETSDQPSWDGLTQSGIPANSGVYFFTYQFLEINGIKKDGHGFVHLIDP